MTQIPFPIFNWNSTNIIADAKYFETQCTRFFKGPLKDEDDNSKLAYVLLWLNNREFESSYEDWTPPIKDENILKHFWKKFKEHFNKHNISKYTYRHMLHTVRQLHNETTRLHRTTTCHSCHVNPRENVRTASTPTERRPRWKKLLATPTSYENRNT